MPRLVSSFTAPRTVPASRYASMTGPTVAGSSCTRTSTPRSLRSLRNPIGAAPTTSPRSMRMARADADRSAAWSRSSSAMLDITWSRNLPIAVSADRVPSASVMAFTSLSRHSSTNERSSGLLRPSRLNE